jgi:hypothetical protein
LTVILRGERMPGTEDGPARILQTRCQVLRYGGPTTGLAEAGTADRRRRRARQGFRPRGRDIADAPESDSSPRVPQADPAGDL